MIQISFHLQLLLSWFVQSIPYGALEKSWPCLLQDNLTRLEGIIYSWSSIANNESGKELWFNGHYRSCYTSLSIQQIPLERLKLTRFTPSPPNTHSQFFLDTWGWTWLLSHCPLQLCWHHERIIAKHQKISVEKTMWIVKARDENKYKINIDNISGAEFMWLLAITEGQTVKVPRAFLVLY